MSGYRHGAFILLDLPETSSRNDVNHRFREMQLKYHPDKQSGQSEAQKRDNLELSKAINTARDQCLEFITQREADHSRQRSTAFQPSRPTPPTPHFEEEDRGNNNDNEPPIERSNRPNFDRSLILVLSSPIIIVLIYTLLLYSLFALSGLLLEPQPNSMPSSHQNHQPDHDTRQTTQANDPRDRKLYKYTERTVIVTETNSDTAQLRITTASYLFVDQVKGWKKVDTKITQGDRVVFRTVNRTKEIYVPSTFHFELIEEVTTTHLEHSYNIAWTMIRTTIARPGESTRTTESVYRDGKLQTSKAV
ncbi:hypothetical protein BV898_16864 [Hypsibius exemplaris]|uniref:J domain-containing protein n=1 Tax=Hypsibius exemplaris TaxID=2072580 RepID=A0A9X6NDZ5_HYPEX|nr:hypothetical protein BV898_16864 [Hypsibius exemplaris]